MEKCCDLNHLENRLHWTRSARFGAARRLRRRNVCNIYSQVLASVILVAWSLVPFFFKDSAANSFLSFFIVVASVYLLAATLVQSASNDVDQARTLEASARAIDALRLQIHAGILGGKNEDSRAYSEYAKSYSDLLDGNDINHDDIDSKIVGAKGYKLFCLWCIYWLRTGVSLYGGILLVIVLPAACLLCGWAKVFASAK